jgi:hypothetical protein
MSTTNTRPLGKKGQMNGRRKVSGLGCCKSSQSLHTKAELKPYNRGK